MKIVKKLITDLLPADYNPRKDLQPTDNEYKQLKRSIEEFGYVEPIIYNIQTGVVVGGHQRLKVLSDLGYSEVDCVEVDIDITKEKALNIALNKISGDWDEDKLKDLLSELQGLDFDMDLTGFTAEDLSDLNLDISVEDKKEVIEDDFTEDVEPICKRGDIWLLGNHRLMCGDSTSKEDVDKLMNGDKADMVFTDPPYGVSYTGGVVHGNEINVNHKRIMLKNDDVDIYSAFIPLIKNYIDDGAIYIFYATSHSYEVFKPLYENDFELNSVIAWVKINTGYADLNSNYKNKYEPCIYCKRKGKKLNFVGPTTENTVWEINKDRDNKLHPTQKPIEVPARAISNSSVENDIVLDFFGGSGSTLIACEQLGRKCRMMELDEHYCDVIINRWETLTGQKAEKVE